MMQFFKRVLGNGKETIARRELYLFKTGAVVRAYTNGDAFVEHLGYSFEPHVIKRGRHKSGAALEKEVMDIEFSLQSELAQNLSRSELEELTTVEMFAYEGTEFSQFWSGRLVKVKPKSEGITLQFETEYTKVGRNAVTRRIQAPCPYRVFGDECGLKKENYAIKTTIKSVDKLNIVVRGLEAYADNYFKIGMIEEPTGVLITIDESKLNALLLKRRYDSFSKYVLSDVQLAALLADIANKQTALNQANADLVTAQLNYDNAVLALSAAQPEDLNYAELEQAVADTLLLRNNAQNIANDAETTLQQTKDAIPYVTLYPGCMRTPTACKAYGNMPNYGGFPFVPTDNPLEKQVI
ncbi:phage BR0599 family protein [Acinetobacter terrestris]|uniref:phage BR0599 family protein n=1 Tax=Acinetobacter terrestris TaxID=2529843 RepID=UPI001BE4ACF9|nr:phage BR0599 family protein [Acinetobacter terrestris]